MRRSRRKLFGSLSWPSLRSMRFNNFLVLCGKSLSAHLRWFTHTAHEFYATSEMASDPGGHGLGGVGIQVGDSHIDVHHDIALSHHEARRHGLQVGFVTQTGEGRESFHARDDSHGVMGKLESHCATFPGVLDGNFFPRPEVVDTSVAALFDRGDGVAGAPGG